MKKLFLIVAVIATICLTGCVKVGDKEIKDSFIKETAGLKAYYMEGTLKLTNNDDNYAYDVEVSYQKDNNYKVSLVNKANEYEQIILKNKDEIYVITPSLNKSFKFQSDWPNNNSQSYLLHSVAKDLKDDSGYKFTQKDKDYIFTTKTNYPNNPKYVKQNITLNKNFDLKKVEVQDDKDITYIEFTVKNLDKKANFSENEFSLEEITKDFEVQEDSESNESTQNNSANDNSKKQETNSGETSTKNSNESTQNSQTDKETNKSITDENENSQTNESTTRNTSDSQTSESTTENNQTNSNQATSETSKIDENIFPLYLPSNTSLTDKEVIETTNGERVIMTFSGDNPFILVQETVKPSKELEIIPTYGEPFMLIDTVGSLTDTSYTWTSNGVEYYIVSDQMAQTELLEVAKSINIVSTINEK